MKEQEYYKYKDYCIWYGKDKEKLPDYQRFILSIKIRKNLNLLFKSIFNKLRA